MRTIIIDDESKGRKTLCNFISRYAPELDIVGEADSVDSGVKIVDLEKPDLVFLDVQMPDGTGFDLLGLVTWSGFKVVFVTAFDNYAVKAFRFSAVDYLLKPLDPEVFKAAIGKLETLKPIVRTTQHDLLKTPHQKLQKIALHTSDGIDFVEIDNIVRCESSGNYTQFHIQNGDDILVTKTLKEFDELLTEKGFIRVHKSHLINQKHVVSFLKNDGGWLKMSDQSLVEVSRRRKEHLLGILGNSG